MTLHLHATILLVEDDPGHARLIERNLRRAGVTQKLTRIEDGQKAIDYFFPAHDTVDSSSVDIPHLVLLDLNLPGADGYQVLERLKTNPHTKPIPVFILSSTDEPQDIERCYALGCNAYLHKPVEYDQFADAIQRLGSLVSIVRIPKGG
ncbi:response regulator [Candidatus Entotheonella palauensis]|uniref:response regulator n=1 Tax=Candidatus Entotheonella palauensis TaxID=93172 RepID=UPI000B7FA211|nr:response regulator [Candidatus Entotheonella palauensis]